MISVCIAAYNGEKYILEQLRSILPQLGAEDEIIVSDDGSSDKTLEYLYTLQDSRIKILTHPKTHRVNIFDYTTHNFEYALSHASGEIIFLADQDDVWLPGKVREMVALLENNMLVVSDCKITDAHLAVRENSYFKVNRSAPGVVRNIIHNSFLGSCMAFKRELLSYALPFPDSCVAHDIWLGLLASIYGRVALLPNPLILYRRHLDVVSPSGGGHSTFSLKFKISYRLKIVKCLILRLYENKTHSSHF